ncbi:MAG: glycoside hydrolase family 18 protein [Methylobacter sp.]
MSSMTKLVNAWIFLNEDEPAGTDYNSPSSCYQTLIYNNVYQSIDILYLCFVTTVPTGPDTTPVGDGSSYTIEIGASAHPLGLTNQDYMNYIIRDARKNNPDIKIAVTLNWGDGSLLSNIFSNSGYSPNQNAENFAGNLMDYLKSFDLDGFDIDWESPISDQTTQNQFELLINAIGAQFKQQTDKHYYLTLSPAEVGNLDAGAVNNNMDFVNLQLYSGFTIPSEFTQAGVRQNLLAYGAKFEADGPSGPDGNGHQTAKNAYDGYTKGGYSVITNWRLNSENYEFEQAQQKDLYQLVFSLTGTT